MFDRLLMNRVGRYKDLVILASWQVQAIFSWRKRWAILLGSYDRFGLYRSGSCRAPWATVWLPTVAGPLGRTDVCTYTAMHTGGGGGQKSLGLVEGLTINQLIFHVCRWFKLSSSVKTKQNFIYLAWCDYIRAFLLVSTYVIHINESTKNQNQNRLETLTRPTNLKPASLLPPPPNLGNGLNEKRLTWPDVMFFEIINHFDRVEIWGTD